MVGLAFSNELEKYSFLNEDFYVNLQLVDDGEISFRKEPLAIGLSLCYDDGTEVRKDAYSVRNEKKLKIEGAVCKAGLVMYSEALVEERRRLKIKAWLSQEQEVGHVYSNSFCIVRHKLEVEYDQQWAKTFYKDMGGKDSCLKLKVKLVDKNKRGITNRNVKVKATLHRSDNNAIVSNILTLLNNSNGDIFELNRGSAEVKARITDVSMHHGNSDFYISFHAEGALNADVAPAVTQAVNVKSKKNHKRKHTLLNSTVSQLSINSNAGSTGNAAATTLNQSRSMHTRTANSMSEDLFRCKQQAEELANFAASATGDEARSALAGYATFISHVFETLDTIQWRSVGYTHDYGQTHYLFDNPNDTIQNLVSSFDSTSASVPKRNESPRGSVADSGKLVSYQSEDADQPEEKSSPRDDSDDFLPPFVPIDKSWNQQSSLYVPDIPTKAESSAADALQALQQPPFKRPRMSAAQGGEECIAVVFAKKFKPYGASFDLGFPCYDAKGRLLGLYQDCNGDDLVFLSTDDANLNQQDIDMAHDCYPEQFEKKSQCIIKRSDFPHLYDLKEHVKSYNESKVFCSIDMDCGALLNDPNHSNTTILSSKNNSNHENAASTTCVSSVLDTTTGPATATGAGHLDGTFEIAAK